MSLTDTYGGGQADEAQDDSEELTPTPPPSPPRRLPYHRLGPPPPLSKERQERVQPDKRANHRRDLVHLLANRNWPLGPPWPLTREKEQVLAGDVSSRPNTPRGVAVKSPSTPPTQTIAGLVHTAFGSTRTPDLNTDLLNDDFPEFAARPASRTTVQRKAMEKVKRVLGDAWDRLSRPRSPIITPYPRTAMTQVSDLRAEVEDVKNDFAPSTSATPLASQYPADSLEDPAIAHIVSALEQAQGKPVPRADQLTSATAVVPDALNRALAKSNPRAERPTSFPDPIARPVRGAPPFPEAHDHPARSLRRSTLTIGPSHRMGYIQDKSSPSPPHLSAVSASIDGLGLSLGESSKQAKEAALIGLEPVSDVFSPASTTIPKASVEAPPITVTDPSGSGTQDVVLPDTPISEASPSPVELLSTPMSRSSSLPFTPRRLSFDEDEFSQLEVIDEDAKNADGLQFREATEYRDIFKHPGYPESSESLGSSGLLHPPSGSQAGGVGIPLADSQWFQSAAYERRWITSSKAGNDEIQDTYFTDSLRFPESLANDESSSTVMGLDENVSGGDIDIDEAPRSPASTLVGSAVFASSNMTPPHSPRPSSGLFLPNSPSLASDDSFMPDSPFFEFGDMTPPDSPRPAHRELVSHGSPFFEPSDMPPPDSLQPAYRELVSPDSPLAGPSSPGPTAKVIRPSSKRQSKFQRFEAELLGKRYVLPSRNRRIIISDARTVKAGDEVVSELPLVPTLSTALLKYHCSQCLLSARQIASDSGVTEESAQSSFIPCVQCKRVVFCSSVCDYKLLITMYRYS